MKKLEPYIIGEYTTSDYFSFIIYSDKAPLINELLELNGDSYMVESIIDDTTDEEFNEGLSYSKVTVIKL